MSEPRDQPQILDASASSPARESSSHTSPESLLRKVSKLTMNRGGGSTLESRLQNCCELLQEYSEKYTGVYIYAVDGSDLVLKGFSGGDTEHKVIPISRGVCGLAARQKQTVNVGDVRENKDYIVCSVQTRSELVVPVFLKGHVVAEIDIDSDVRNAFTLQDEKLIEEVAFRISKVFENGG